MAEKLSAKHARLVEIYGTPDPGLSLEQGLRRQRLAHYHAMLSKAALRRELLKVNPNRQSPATRTLTEVSSLLRASRSASGGH